MGCPLLPVTGRVGRRRPPVSNLIQQRQPPITSVHQILPPFSWYQEKPMFTAEGSRITDRVPGWSIQAPSVSISVS